MAFTAERLVRGDKAAFVPNSKGDIPGRQRDIVGVVLGKKESQREGVPNVVVEVQEGLIPVKKSFSGKTVVRWVLERN